MCHSLSHNALSSTGVSRHDHYPEENRQSVFDCLERLFAIKFNVAGLNLVSSKTRECAGHLILELDGDTFGSTVVHESVCHIRRVYT